MRKIFLSAGTITSIVIHVYPSKFFIAMSGWFASIFLYVLIVKYHRIVPSVLSIIDFGLCSYHFSVWDRLKLLHNIQYMKLVTRSDLWIQSALTIIGHPCYMIYCFLPFYAYPAIRISTTVKDC